MSTTTGQAPTTSAGPGRRLPWSPPREAQDGVEVIRSRDRGMRPELERRTGELLVTGGGAVRMHIPHRRRMIRDDGAAVQDGQPSGDDHEFGLGCARTDKRVATVAGPQGVHPAADRRIDQLARHTIVGVDDSIVGASADPAMRSACPRGPPRYARRTPPSTSHPAGSHAPAVPAAGRHDPPAGAFTASAVVVSQVPYSNPPARPGRPAA